MMSASTRASKAGKDKTSKNAAQTTKPGNDVKPDGPNHKIQPTAEQMRLAQIINDTKESDDPELKTKIDQVIELTGKSRDEAVVALHDCDNDPNRAIDMLLEGETDQGEWEMSVKKKKNRPVNPVGRQPETSNSVVNNKENRNRGGDKGGREPAEKDAPEVTRNRGPPRMNRGSNKSWRGRESEKNEKNLEDSKVHERSAERNTDRNTDGLGRGRSMNGPGRGGRGRGARVRTFQNRGSSHGGGGGVGSGGGGGGFPKSIETWSNSTAEQGESGGGGDSTLNVGLYRKKGNWSDNFPPTEDWDNEDWTGSLAETKVFTASASAAAASTAATAAASSIPPPLQDSTNTSQGIDLAALLKGGGGQAGGVVSNAQQHSQFLSQYTQQATESLKNAVGIGLNTSSSNQPSNFQSLQSSTFGGTTTFSASTKFNSGSGFGSSPVVPASQAGTTAPVVSPAMQQQPGSRKVTNPTVAASNTLPPRVKTQRTRLPPPSKIPSSAVEMPDDDAITSLDVQFGGLEFGSEQSTFEFDNSYSSTTTGSNVSSVISNHITSMAGSHQQNSSPISSSVMSSQVGGNGGGPMGKVQQQHQQAEPVNRGSYGPSSTTAKELPPQQSSLPQSALVQGNLSQSALGPSSLSQKGPPPELLGYSSQADRKANTPFGAQRQSQSSATLSGSKDPSGMNAAYVGQSNHNHSSGYQSSYQNQKTSSGYSSHPQSNLGSGSSNSYSHTSLQGHQSSIGVSQSLSQTGLNASSQPQSGSFIPVQSAPPYQSQTSYSSTQQQSSSFQSSSSSSSSFAAASAVTHHHHQQQNTFPSQNQSTFVVGGGGSGANGGAHHQSSSALGTTGSGGVFSSSASGSQQQQGGGGGVPPPNSAYGSQSSSSYGSSSSPLAAVQTHNSVHSTPITTSKLASNLNVKDSSLDSSSQHSFDSCHTTSSSTNLASTLTSTTASSLNSGSVNVSVALGLSTTTSITSSSSSSTGGVGGSTKTSASSGKTNMPSMPPGVPAVLGHQYIMASQASMPFYGLQQPVYGYEDLQMLQQRLPMAGYYDVSAFQPATSITGRESGLATLAYSGTDGGKFSRGDNNSPVPTTLSQQTTTQHQQQFINAAALPPGYGYYYPAPQGVVTGSFQQYGTPIFPMPPVTNATNNSQFQKPTAYASHGYNSAYENLSQNQDYKGSYGSSSQSQSKGVGGSSSTSGCSSSAGDISAGSVYSKTHSQLGKSFDKPGFPAGTPPPFNIAGTQTGPMGAPASYPPFITMMAHHQQHQSPMLHHQLHQDSQGSGSQRSSQSASQQQKQGGPGSKQSYSSQNNWTNPPY